MGRTRRVSVYILMTTALGGKKKTKIEQKKSKCEAFPSSYYSSNKSRTKSISVGFGFVQYS